MPTLRARSTFLAGSLTALIGLLSACGGGGGGGGGGTSSDARAQAAAVSPVTSVSPPANYAPTSAQAGALTYYNTERLRCGFGLLAQSAALDAAAQAHATYLANRWDADVNYTGGHTEVAGLSGYTGATPIDRIRAAGYTGATAAEGISYAQDVYLASADVDRGTRLMQMLLAVPYHAAALMNNTMEVGLGHSRSSVATMNSLVVTNGSRTAAGQQSSDVVTFPCEGSRVRAFTTGENPDPWVGSGWSAPYGPSILVRAPAGQRMRITGVTLYLAGSSTPLETRVLDVDSDPQQQLTSDTAAVLIRAQLSDGLAYTATISGTSGGTPFSRQFTFVAVN